MTSFSFCSTFASSISVNLFFFAKVELICIAPSAISLVFCKDSALNLLKELLIHLFKENLEEGMQGINYIPEELRGPIFKANEAYIGVAER